MSETIEVLSPPPSLSFNQEVILIAIKHGQLLPREIGEKINKSPFYNIKTSTLYPILNRLEKSGFILSYDIDGKRHYSLSNEGGKLIEITEKIRKLVINGQQNSND